MGIENTLAWGISMPKITSRLYEGLIQLAQPGIDTLINDFADKQSKGSPNKGWLDPYNTTNKNLEFRDVNDVGLITIDTSSMTVKLHESLFGEYLFKYKWHSS